MENVTAAVLRPKQAAAYIGVSLPTFWRYAKEEPDFPQPFRLGANASAVMREELDAWLKAKREAA